MTVLACIAVLAFTNCLTAASQPSLTSQVFVRSEGKVLQVSDGSLKPSSYRVDSGRDKLGRYWSKVFMYVPSELENATLVITEERYYSPNLTIYTQTFPNGLGNASSGSRDGVISGYPCFQWGGGGNDTGFWSLGGYHFGWMRQQFGLWNDQGVQPIELGRESGPLVWVDTKSNKSTIVTAFDNFMASQLGLNSSAKEICWGIQGNVSQVPAQFSISFIQVTLENSTSVRDLMALWGSVMTRYYGKTPASRETDLTNNYLGYYTDNGAFYYYQTESGKTYEQTILDLVQHLKEQLPIKYIQYDSWFYPKNSSHQNRGGVTEWTGKEEVFPHNMTWLNEQLALPVVAHNRWWDGSTVYAKQNGGNFDFIIEDDIALPRDPNFWTFLFSQSRKWGLATYEQDWQNLQFERMVATTGTLHVASDWLIQMGEGARVNGLAIQYCMALPKSALQSVQVPAVSQARVGDDYQPGTYGAGGDQWKIGHTSMFAWALNLAPFKDTFWSSEYQPGSRYEKNETRPELQAVVATLSAGPVAPGDAIGRENSSLILRSVNSDGLILKPDMPAFPIDAQTLQLMRLITDGPRGEVWTTMSTISEYHFGIIFTADLEANYNLHIRESGIPIQPASIVYGQDGYDLKRVNSGVLSLTQCDGAKPCLYYTSPPINWPGRGDQLFILGDLSKWVPMSSKRVTTIQRRGDDLQLEISGGAGELVTVSFSTGDLQLKRITCTMGASGSNTLSLTLGTCIH